MTSGRAVGLAGPDVAGGADELDQVVRKEPSPAFREAVPASMRTTGPPER